MASRTLEHDGYIALNAIRLWEDNYNEGDVGAICISIRRFGFNQALRLWLNNECRAGNHTVKALRALKAQGPLPEYDQQWPPAHVLARGGEWFVPYIDVSHLSEAEANAYAIADNRTAQLASVNEDRLATLLQNIAVEDRSLAEATGYDGDAIDDMLRRLARKNGVPDEDEGAHMDRADELQCPNCGYVLQGGA